MPLANRCQSVKILDIFSIRLTWPHRNLRNLTYFTSRPLTHKWVWFSKFSQSLGEIWFPNVISSLLMSIKISQEIINKAELLQLNCTQFSSLGIFLVKMLEIEKTKTTFNISVLNVVYWVVLFFLISNFFINKNSQGRKLSAKKIPSSGNSAL